MFKKYVIRELKTNRYIGGSYYSMELSSADDARHYNTREELDLHLKENFEYGVPAVLGGAILEVVEVFVCPKS